MRFTWMLIMMMMVSQSICVAAPILIVGDDSYRPIIYTEKDRAQGVLVESLNVVMAAMNKKNELNLVPWARAIKIAQDGQQGIVGISMNEERLKVFDFSEPLAYDDIVIVVKKGKEFPYTELKDLAGKTVGVQNGASYGQDADLAIKDHLFTKNITNDPAQRLEMLLAGRLDAVFIGNGKVGLDLAIKGHASLESQREQLVILPNPLTRDKLYLAFHKKMKRQELIAEFNKTLTQLAKENKVPGLIRSDTK